MSKKRKALIAVAGLLAVTISVAAYMRWQLKQGRATPPPPGVSMLDQQVAFSGELPKGFVVWSSNRSGSHDILMMSLPDRKITPLTTSSHTDYFPRISPDGRYVVFARSQKPWVPQRNQLLWDTYLVEVATGKERLLAKNANSPSWSVDGKKVYFQRNAMRLAEVDVKTGEERILFTSGQGKVKKNAILNTPAFNTISNKIAVTLRGGQRMMAIVDLDGNINRISDGCQLVWSKDGSFLYFVDYGGKMKNAFYTYNPETRKSEIWLDMPGEYSHEYFPKLSNDEKYLVFGASKEGHEHDSADYEIFLWQVGTPAEDVIRLTYHTGNDNWPDVYLY